MPKVYKSRNNPVCQTTSKALRASISATYKGDLLLFASAISSDKMRAAILQIPKTLKSGIACPILKKGKPAHDPNSYRKITITNLIGKVIEKIHLT
jgi:hypothetical protein